MTKKLRFPIAAIFLIISTLSMFLSLLDTIMDLGLIYVGIVSWLTITVNIILCVFLVLKKHDIFLLIAYSLFALLSLYNLIIALIDRLYIFFYASIFVANLITLLFVFITSVNPIVKADLTKAKNIVKMVFFLPAVLVFGAITIDWIQLLTDPFIAEYGIIYTFGVVNLLKLILSDVMQIAFYLTFGMWLKDPYRKTAANNETVGHSQTSSNSEYDKAYCSLGTHIALCLLTCGIWYLIWTYRTTKYLNKAPNYAQHNPTTELLLCMFVPFYQLYWLYKHGQKIDAMSIQKNLNQSDIASLCLLFGIFLPIVAYIVMQDRINALCTARETVTEIKTNTASPDDLRKYKELFDEGVITQEEFDAKKRQILGL